jgi:hypothetical protein
VTLVNLTTMDRRIQNAYSRQGSIEIEREVGGRTTISAGYQYMRGLRLIAQVNQNVPSCVASGSNNGCRPIADYANNNQYSSAGDSTYHAVHVSLVERPSSWGNYRVSYTLSKSMNDVGEAFFNSPIDPFDIRKDWGRSDDDQRHRLVADGAVHTRAADVSGIVQAYSALPFNITSGTTTVQGTAGRPVVNGEFIPRNVGVGTPFFSINMRGGHTFHAGARASLQGFVEVFNLTNHRNVVTRNGNFGSGAFPTSPSPAFGQITAVGDPRTMQIGIRAQF